MAFEALNNAGRSKTNTIVVLNDNGMAISRNVGGIARGMTRIRISRKYFHAKDRVPPLSQPDTAGHETGPGHFAHSARPSRTSYTTPPGLRISTLCTSAP